MLIPWSDPGAISRLLSPSPSCSKCASGDIAVVHNVTKEHLRDGRTADYHSRRNEHLGYLCRNCRYEWEGDCFDSPAAAEERSRRLGVLKKIDREVEEFVSRDKGGKG